MEDKKGKVDVTVNNSLLLFPEAVSSAVIVHMLFSEVFQHDLRLDPETGCLCWTVPPQNTHPFSCPYGLTWLQCECGEILVKMWYVAAALAETLLEPSDVLFYTSGGYDTLLVEGFATMRS